MFEKFVADRMQKGSGKYSRPIVRIAILGIILGVAVMILSASIVRGFRTEIRDKVVGFNAHLQSTDVASSIGTEDRRVPKSPDFLKELAGDERIASIRPYITRPTIIESAEGIEGLVAKGLVPEDQSGFLSARLLEGQMPNMDSKEASKEVLLSASTAQKMDLSLGDRVSLYFIKEGSDFSQRRLIISGIYQTDLEEFDAQYLFLDLRHLQKLSGWGLEIQALSLDSCDTAGNWVELRGFGGGDRHYFQWSDGEMGAEARALCPESGETMHAVLKDNAETLPDTVFFSFLPVGRELACDCPFILDSIYTAGGSAKHYAGGHEFFLHDFADLAEVKAAVQKASGPFYFTSDIVERTPEIFSWLEILDVNIYIIITLMIGVAIFNMSSALLILMIERSNMIGILKALGSANWSVRKIFIHHAGSLILKGLFWGNVLGVGVAWVQKQFQLIALDAKTYYLSRVPVHFDWMDILLIDAGTLLICLLAMLVPSYFITRITPVKAIRFD